MQLPLIDQIAVWTRDIDAHVRFYHTQNPHAIWIRDQVDAIHIYLAPQYRGLIGESFQVKLAFNYETITEGIEYELIQLVNGHTVQLLDAPFTGERLAQGISHIGYHVPASESFSAHLQKWREIGCSIAQVSQTVLHANTHRFYRYAFLDARNFSGVWIKVIERVPPGPFSVEEMVAAARKELAWLE